MVRGKNVGKNHDQYCWICSANQVQTKCSKCPRSFHNQCLQRNEIDSVKNSEFVCSDCLKLKTSDENADK